MNYVVGDIHGLCEPFKELVAQIEEKDSDAIIYCVGDYCDRGPDSKGVVDFILSKNNIRCVRGNHDDVFDCIINGRPTPDGDCQGGSAPLESLAWFLSFGMKQTLASYGIYQEDIMAGSRSIPALKQMCAKIPQEHKDFYANLPLNIDTPDFLVVHAALVPQTGLKDAMEYKVHRQAMLWGRFNPNDLLTEKAWKKIGYFGHTPTTSYGSSDPIFSNDIVLVDTGGVFNGKLSAVCHETKEVFTVIVKK